MTDTKVCPKCKKPVMGEMDVFCKFCGYSFGSGGDRWFSSDDESLPRKEFD